MCVSYFLNHAHYAAKGYVILGHEDVFALAPDCVTQFLKNTDCIFLTDAG